MKGWNVKRVDEIGKIITGKTPSSDYPDEFGLKYPFITPSDIPNTQKYISVERFLSEKGMESHKRIKLPPKTTCVVCIGATIGKVCTTTVYSFSNQQINNIIPNEENDPDFVYYLASTLKDALVSFAGGAATPIVNKSAFSSIKVLVPAKKCQRKIAAILSAYDDLIENNNRRIAILEKMAEELYREWFVRLRFPGHEKVKIAKGVTEGWEVKKLGDIVELMYGKALKEDHRAGGKFPVYGSSGVVGFHNQFIVVGPGIIIGRKGNIGNVIWSDEPFYPIDTVYFVKTEYSMYFIYYLLQKLNFLNNDAAVPGLNRNQAYSNRLIFPTKTLIVLFNDTVKPIFDIRKILIKTNQSLTESRDRLLSRLMSGKIDVEDMDIQFPASMRCAEPVEAQEEAVDA